MVYVLTIGYDPITENAMWEVKSYDSVEEVPDLYSYNKSKYFYDSREEAEREMARLNVLSVLK